MIQRFIELGEGFSDLYELIEIAKTNENRLTNFLALKTNKNDNKVCSLAITLKAAGESNYQPIYICREGIPMNSKRWSVFEECAQKLNREVITLEVRPSNEFSELDLYYQYLTGILRLQHLLPAWM